MNREQWQKASGVLKAWHEALDDDRGGRAELRRCRSVAELYGCAAGFNLLHALERAGINTSDDREKWLKVAGVLTHFRESSKGRVGRDMAVNENHTVLTKGRFRRLLKSREEQLFTGLIRIAPIMKRRINFEGCARLLLDWQKEETKKRLAEDYYLNLPK